MKKHSVFSLCVVKKGDIYFICKYTNLVDTYEEFFTKELIVEKNKKNIEGLSEYYSLLGVKNYKTGKPLMLSKQDILEKYIEINKIEREKTEETKKVKEEKFAPEDSLFIQVWEETTNEKQKIKK